MKTAAIVIVIIAFLWVCVSMARDKRTATTKPVLSGDVTWRYTQEHFDKGTDRYTIRILSSSRVTDEEVKQLAEYTKATHTETGNLIIFFDQSDRSGAYARYDYPAGTVEKLENFER